MKEQAYKNIRLVKSFYAAVSSGSFDTARAVLAPDVEWIEPNLPGLWFSGTHRGAEAVFKEVYGPAVEKLEKFCLKMRKFFAVGDHVIALGKFCGRNRYSHTELNGETAHVWTIHKGKAIRFEAFHDPSSWEETLGLPRPILEGIAA